ncbi:MAG: hypothetical protein WCS16_06710 [Desulfuromonas sp.]
MKNYFCFTIVCQPKNEKELITQSNDAANAVARNLDKILNCFTNIYSPNVNFSLRHEKNNKDLHYNYVITTNSIVDTETNYHSLAELIYEIISRAINSIGNRAEAQPNHITPEHLSVIQSITTQPLTDEDAHTIQAQIELMLRTLARLTTNITVLLFRSDHKDQDSKEEVGSLERPQTKPPQPTLFGNENNNTGPNWEGSNDLPPKAQHTECVECVQVTCKARYNKKGGRGQVLCCNISQPATLRLIARTLLKFMKA